MNTLISLAQELTRRGDLFIQKFGTKSFHHEARTLLEKAELHRCYNFQELVTSVYSNEFPKEQNFKYLEFSDLPLTIARGEKCFIDLYFWRRRPTVIHNHHFSGAFQCLVGNNVDLEFSFTEKQTLGTFHALGELTLKRELNLVPGQVVEIAELDQFIHQNHHQDDLTVNLCFRTHDLGKHNLSNYLFSGLRFEKDSELLARTSRLLKLIDLGSFDVTKLPFNLDDAFAFILHTHYSASTHPHFRKVREHFCRRIHNETGIAMSDLMGDHDKRFNDIEDNYA